MLCCVNVPLHEIWLAALPASAVIKLCRRRAGQGYAPSFCSAERERGVSGGRERNREEEEERESEREREREREQNSPGAQGKDQEATVQVFVTCCET